MLEKEGLDLDDVEEYLRRLDAGLYSLQLADYILAWICMEDDGVSRGSLCEAKGVLNLCCGLSGPRSCSRLACQSRFVVQGSCRCSGRVPEEYRRLDRHRQQDFADEWRCGWHIGSIQRGRKAAGYRWSSARVYSRVLINVTVP